MKMFGLAEYVAHPCETSKLINLLSVSAVLVMTLTLRFVVTEKTSTTIAKLSESIARNETPIWRASPTNVVIAIVN